MVNLNNVRPLMKNKYSIQSLDIFSWLKQCFSSPCLIEYSHPKVEERIVDFMDLKLYSDKFHGGNVAFCCIGTTLSKVKKVI